MRAFLDRTWPASLGTVATIRDDGSPHVVPVWYRFDGRAVHIWTHHKRVWVTNLMHDNRVAFSVQEAQPPYAAVILRGRADVVMGEDEEISAEIRRITARYIAAPDVASYIQGWPELRAWRATYSA